MGCHETTGTTSRKISVGFATDKTVNQVDVLLGVVQELMDLYEALSGFTGERGAGKNKDSGRQRSTQKELGRCRKDQDSMFVCLSPAPDY